MSFKGLPKFVEVELSYPYLSGPVTYKFPRLRKKDVELDRLERLKGNGHKENPAVRLSGLIEDVHGWEEYGFEPRGADEMDGQWRQRVITFFNNEDMQECAEHALIYRTEAIFPAHTFRSTTDSGIQVDRARTSTGPGTALPILPTAGQGSPE